MMLPLAHWPPRRLLKVWAAGLLLEAVLLLSMFVLLVRPEPPLVARLRGEDTSLAYAAGIRVDTITGPMVPIVPNTVAPPWPAHDDSFYTVLHWPLDKPLLGGGGRVLAFPMRLWWVPALYVGAAPLVLLAFTGTWLLVRHRPRP